MVVLTSGSTGNSKAVVLTHENLLSSMASKADVHQLTAADVSMNWISFDHVAAMLEVHLLSLYVGATQLHAQSETILADPLLFLRLIDQFRVSMTFSPNFLLGQINVAVQRDWPDNGAGHTIGVDLSCLRHIISGGEANVVETGRRFLDLLAPYGLSRDVLWPAFGMTETCAGLIYSREFPEIDVGREFASVGAPIKGLEIRTVGESRALLGAGQIGELQLKGPMIFNRYHNNEDATRAAFTEDGWFRTGDLGEIDNGRLTLVGRKKDSIVISGVNYLSHELETTLEQLDGIERSFVVAFATRSKGADTEELVITFAVTFPMTVEDRLYQLIVAVRNTTVMLWGFRPALVLPLPKSAFQKTSLGKIQRSIMRKRIERGDFAADNIRVTRLMERQLGAYSAPDGQLEHEVVAVFGEMFGLDAERLSATANFFDLGGTSLEILKLTRTLEQRFRLRFTLTTVLQDPTPRRLAAYIGSEAGSKIRVYDPIVPMQISGDKTPLFCIHPGNGGILVYVNLAKYFVNERPFYALRPRGFDEGETCFETFEEMERAYVEAICKYQPRGPYAILGYSFGGPIAFEIAKALRAGGEKVAFLGCIDGPPLVANQWSDVAGQVVCFASLLNLITREQAEQAIKQFRTGALNGALPEIIMAMASRDRVAELGLDVEKFSTWTRVVVSLFYVCAQHETSGMVDEMTVFYGDDTAGGEEWFKSIRDWSTFVGRPRYISVAGDHATLMSPRRVADFQAVLRAEINEAFLKEGITK